MQCHQHAPLSLIISEGQDFILSDRTTDCAAELFPVPLGTWRCPAAILRRSLREGSLAKLEFDNAQIKSGAVYFVSADLVWKSRWRRWPAKLGVVILRSDL